MLVSYSKLTFKNVGGKNVHLKFLGFGLTPIQIKSLMAGMVDMAFDLDIFQKRFVHEEPRENDWRSAYSRDKARIIHSSGFRRLQGKTQVMGIGEGDFHRTRLTHSLEVNQIGLGLFNGFEKRADLNIPKELIPFLKHGHPVISAACYGHDLGHPPFGHGGERALHSKMKNYGGFEGNAQTIRILLRLEKYHKDKGINPTRRVLLSVLKYPVNYGAYPDEIKNKVKPPKCYYDSEKQMIEWCLIPFSENDKKLFRQLKDDKSKPQNMAFDASIMECADDIAYSTHDLEDIVARELISKEKIMDEVHGFFNNTKIGGLGSDQFSELFKDSYERKKFIGKLVNTLMTNTEIYEIENFEHPLLKYRLKIRDELRSLADFIGNTLTYKMVVNKPEIQMLEIKGQRVVTSLFDEFIKAPDKLIPHWNTIDKGESNERNVCDYIAGMTDSFSAKIYHRLFTPGVGSSRDEL